jgi:hypothetical protein
MVQIGDNHAMINAQPVGQVVKFSTWPKTYEPELMGGAFSDFPIGRAMTVATTRATFRNMQADWIFGIILPKNIAMKPCEKTVAAYVP